MLQPIDTPTPLTIDSQRPWNRQPFDTDAEWPWFLEFMVQPHPRSLDILEQKYGKMVRRLARQYAWYERAACYDNYIVAEHNRNLSLFTVEAAKRNADYWEEITYNAVEIVRDQLAKYHGMVKEQSHPGGIKINELIRLAEMAFKLEALRTGNPTERVEIGPVKEIIDCMDYQEVIALKALQEKLLKDKK